VFDSPPPPELAAYVAAGTEADPVELYLRQGEEFSRVLLSLLPRDLDLKGERVLDFGCGSGRFLRHLINAGTGAVFDGCDIHAPSIDWLNHHLPGPHQAFVCNPAPPLPGADKRYRLIYAMSVFTHLTNTWAAWMCELHRLLADDGVLIATVMSAPMGVHFEEDPWDEDRIGMLVLGPGRPWDAGGPMVLHSEWWIRAHWGRAFNIELFDDGRQSGFGQGVAVMRKRNVTVTPEQLEDIEPGEPREVSALKHALNRAHAESTLLNVRHDEYARAYHQEAAKREALERKLAHARGARKAARAVARATGAWVRSLMRQVLSDRSTGPAS
jgi:SAM-dependent methyltransferase